MATLAARLPQWLAEEGLTLGIGTPVVVGQVAALVAKWADKIQGFIRALLNSLRRLNGKLNDLTEVIERLKQALRRISRSDPAAGKPSGPDFFSKSPVRSNQDVLDNGPGTPMTLDNVHDVAGRMDIDLQDVDVVIISDPEEIRYLDHMDAGAYTPSELNGAQIRFGPASFADDETLAATIAHEHTHVVQQRGGEHPRAAPAGDDRAVEPAPATAGLRVGALAVRRGQAAGSTGSPTDSAAPGSTATTSRSLGSDRAGT